MINQTEEGLSLGVSKIIDTFYNLSQAKQKIAWDIITINISTLIRNNCSKEVSDETILHNVDEDLDQIVKSISKYYQSFTHPPEQTAVLLYFPDYSALPELHRRTENKTNARIRKITEQFSSRTLTKNTKEKVIMFENLTCIIRKAGTSKLFPHQEIYQYLTHTIGKGALSKIKTLFGLRQLKVAMLSHCPLDFHLCRYTKNFTLIESYTGNTKTAIDFGSKLFDSEYVPFNTATHLLFGDKVHVVPIVKRNHKKMFLEYAKKQRWLTLDEPKIVQLIAATGQVPKQVLTTVKF